MEDKRRLTAEQLDAATGGTANKNPNPGKIDNGLDNIINGDTYDAIAQQVADWINGDDERTRDVCNRDINDYII